MAGSVRICWCGDAGLVVRLAGQATEQVVGRVWCYQGVGRVAI